MDYLLYLEIFFYASSILMVLYYVVFISKFAKHQPGQARFEKLPKVSVIICAKNERDNIERNLEKVLSQRYSDFEVIVVDDNSTDGTKEVLLEIQTRHKHLKILSFNQEKISKGKKQVLEYGIRNSSSDYLVMTDADCWPKSDYWLLNMVGGFADGSELVLGVGLYEKRKGWVNKLIQLDTLHIAIQYISHALAGFPYMSVGRNVGYKRSLFDRVGGFKSHYDNPGGDDDLFINELAKNVKLNVVYSPESQTVSSPKKSFQEFFKQKTRHVSAGLKYNKRNLLILGLYYCNTTLWYVSFVLMICYSGDLATVLTIGLLKKIILLALVHRIFSKIGVGELRVLTIFFDILSIFVQLFATINSITRKEGKW